MRIQIERTAEHHGVIPWSGEFRGEYAVFTCPICGHSIGLCPNVEQSVQFYERGAEGVGHQAYMTLDAVRFALERELWRQKSAGQSVICPPRPMMSSTGSPLASPKESYSICRPFACSCAIA